MECNVFLKMRFFNCHLEFFPENLGVAMGTDSTFIRIFPPRKSGYKASEFSAFWLINVGHLEEMFHRQNIAESHPILYFMLFIYALEYNVNTGFLKISTARPLKTLTDRKI
jgi:hypothetical protein